MDVTRGGLKRRKFHQDGHISTINGESFGYGESRGLGCVFLRMLRDCVLARGVSKGCHVGILELLYRAKQVTTRPRSTA